MSRAVRISIRPKWCEKIADGEWKRPLKRAPQSWQYVEELK